MVPLVDAPEEERRARRRASFLTLIGEVRLLSLMVPRSPFRGRRDELARLLTSRAGTMVDLSGDGGLTPLHLAARGGWEKCASNLLENNASPLTRNSKGQASGAVNQRYVKRSKSQRNGPVSVLV